MQDKVQIRGRSCRLNKKLIILFFSIFCFNCYFIFDNIDYVSAETIEDSSFITFMIDNQTSNNTMFVYCITKPETSNKRDISLIYLNWNLEFTSLVNDINFSVDIIKNGIVEQYETWIFTACLDPIFEKNHDFDIDPDFTYDYVSCNFLIFNITAFDIYDELIIEQFYIEFEYIYQYSVYEGIITDLMIAIFDLIPNLIILFVIPIILYLEFNKIGFLMGLLFSTIIMFITGVISIQLTIVISLSDILLMYKTYKKRDEMIEI